MDQKISIDEFTNILVSKLMEHKECLKALDGMPLRLEIDHDNLTEAAALEMADKIIRDMGIQEKAEPVKNHTLVNEEPETLTSLDKVVQNIFQRSYQPKRLKEEPQKSAIEQFQSIHSELMMVATATYRRLKDEMQKEDHYFSDICVLIDLRSKILSDVTKLCWLSEWMEEFEPDCFQQTKKQLAESFDFCDGLMEKMDQLDLF